MMFLLLAIMSFAAFAQDPFKYSNESNLSIIQTGGNTNLQTYDAKTENYLKRKKEEYNLGGHYVLGESEIEEDGETIKRETARNWDVHGQYTRKFREVWGGFISVKIESDEFSGYEQRNNYDLGGRYTFASTDEFESYFELSYRYTEEYPVEIGERNVFYDNKGRLFYQLTNKPSPQLSYKFWIEYIPNFSRSEDYIISGAPSIASTLTDIFSLQVSYKVIYDNEPAVEGNEKTDYTFSTTLVAKF